MSLRQIFAEIQVVLFMYLWRELTETETVELFVFFILQKHMTLLWLDTNKRKPFAVSNDTLFLSVSKKLRSIFNSFRDHQENMRQTASVRASTPEV